jgi:hypothetical protein
MEGGEVGLLVSITGLRGYVYPVADLAALPTSSAPMPTLPVDMQCTLGVLCPDSFVFHQFERFDILPAAKAGGFWDQQALLPVAV